MKIDEVTGNYTDVYEFIKNHCNEALNSPPIWRGNSSNEDFFKVNSRKLPFRKSANTSNYVNLFVSTMNAWKSFPRRQVICTTDRMYAAGYGNVYRVFPIDGTKIGVCPNSDFWLFPFLKKETANTINGLDQKLEFLIRQLRNDLDVDNTDPGILSTLDKAAEDQTALLYTLQMAGKYYAGRKTFYEHPIVNEMSIINLLTDWLDPKKNKFEISTPRQLPPDTEVWFDSEAILVKEKVTWLMGIKEFN